MRKHVDYSAADMDCHIYTDDKGNKRINHVGGHYRTTGPDGRINSPEARARRQKGRYGEQPNCSSCAPLAKDLLLEEALYPIYGENWRDQLKNSK